MRYERLEYDITDEILVVRLVPITRTAGDFLRQLRDELLDLVVRFRPRQLVTDFDDQHCWPAEILGCLTHAKRAMPPTSLIRCAGMSLRLQAACRFLKLDRGVLEFHASVREAVRASESLWDQTILDAIHPVPRQYFGAA